jgi:hypothetical protein
MEGWWHGTSRRTYIFLLNGSESHELGTIFFMHRTLISAVKRVGIVSEGISCIIYRGHWCQIIVLNVHAQQRMKLMM